MVIKSMATAFVDKVHIGAKNGDTHILQFTNLLVYGSGMLSAALKIQYHHTNINFISQKSPELRCISSDRISSFSPFRRLFLHSLFLPGCLRILAS